MSIHASAEREPSAASLDRIVFRGARATVGEWRCDRRYPSFRDTGPIERYLVAFPRTSVRIRHDGRAAFVADPTLFTVYNRGQRYIREPIHPAGDHCDWWSVDAATARDIASSVDPRSSDDPARPFRFDKGPSDASLYLHQRTVLLRLRDGCVEAIEAEETTIAIVARAIALAAGDLAASALRRSPAHRELADAAKEIIGRRFRERLSLDAIAAAVGVTPFHLCRVFRAQTRTALHRHLMRVRLRAALEPIAQAGTELCDIALDAGFSSHSHFTSAFVREFGVTPSAWRRASAARRAASTRERRRCAR